MKAKVAKKVSNDLDDFAKEISNNVDDFSALDRPLLTPATRKPPLPKHTCHATGCTRLVPPSLLMCAHHWRMVPKHIQRQVWDHYRQGQEIDKRPTMEYLRAAQRAIAFVAETEGADRI